MKRPLSGPNRVDDIVLGILVVLMVGTLALLIFGALGVEP
jgi:hypothetical protein